VLAYTQAILAAERAHGRDDDIRAVNDAGGGAPSALHLHNRWGGACDDIRHLGRKVSKHEVIVAATCARYITRSGRNDEPSFTVLGSPFSVRVHVRLFGSAKVGLKSHHTPQIGRARLVSVRLQADR
jgi:hypothetical protein